MSVFLAGTSLSNDSTVLIVWAVCIGVCLAFVLNFLSKAVVGSFIRALFAKNATSEASAVTLEELGFAKKKLIRLALKNGSALMNTVSIVGGEFSETTVGKRKITDYNNARFYISEEKSDKAKITYGQKEKWYLLVAFIAMAVAIAFIMTKVMPLLVEALF